MPTAEGNPRHGEAIPAGVLRLDGTLAVARLRGVLRLAAVVAEEPVANGAAHGDGEDVIVGSVDAEVRHGGVAAAASADLGAGNGCDGTEDVLGRL